MSILKIREAQRGGARIVIGIAGISGSGKTYSALQLAWGLANGNASKVGLLDTENKRGSLYADILKDKSGKVNRFLIGDLDPPFSPQRYIDAILEFQAAGVEVLVIDSVSHEWSGLGGVIEIVNSFPKAVLGWNKATPEHRRFVNVALQCDMHIIVCVRAAQKTDWTDPKNPKALGLVPIQREDFMFEMTASMMMWSGGQSRDILKCPEDLVPIFGANGTNQNGFLTARHGLQLRKWVDGGVALDAKVENARNTLRTMAERGADALVKQWNELPAAVRKDMGGEIPEEIIAAAKEFDRLRVAAQPGGADLDDLNKQVMGDAPQSQ